MACPRGPPEWSHFSKKGVASLVAQTVKRLPAMQETQVGSLGLGDPLEKEKANPGFSCLENPMDRGAW